MARLNIKILGISELKWKGMGEFNSDDHYTFYYGQEFLRRNEESEPNQKQSPIMNQSGGKSKARCYKEQYCTGTWNARSMNQCKLDVVKQEMARVNINILRISELKWTGMGEFNSDDH